MGCNQGLNCASAHNQDQHGSRILRKQSRIPPDCRVGNMSQVRIAVGKARNSDKGEGARKLSRGDPGEGLSAPGGPVTVFGPCGRLPSRPARSLTVACARPASRFGSTPLVGSSADPACLMPRLQVGSGRCRRSGKTRHRSFLRQSQQPGNGAGTTSKSQAVASVKCKMSRPENSGASCNRRTRTTLYSPTIRTTRRSHLSVSRLHCKGSSVRSCSWPFTMAVAKCCIDDESTGESRRGSDARRFRSQHGECSV